MTITGFEIDFLPVGEETKSGDAILCRYIEDGFSRVILIDGGYQQTSEIILHHMKEYYYPTSDYSDMRIDHIICSHLDQDHIGGLKDVMQKCDVGTLWINNPLDYVNYSSLPD